MSVFFLFFVFRFFFFFNCFCFSAAFPLLSMGGSQFSVLFSVNNVPVKPRDNPGGIPYLFTRSESATEQVHPKLYNSVVCNVPAGKTVVVHITFVRQFSFRGNSMRLYFPSALVNVVDSMDSKAQKVTQMQKILGCFFFFFYFGSEKIVFLFLFLSFVVGRNSPKLGLLLFLVFFMFI